MKTKASIPIGVDAFFCFLSLFKYLLPCLRLPVRVRTQTGAMRTGRHINQEIQF
jgi:hypothetical protein